jgi:ribosome-associated translation inhibitor RaiA
MTYSDQSYDLRIELDQKHCELSADQIAKLEDTLDTLRPLVKSFPVSNLYVTVIYHQPSHDYHVKTSLALSGKTLFTGDRDESVQPAFERCVDKLTHKVQAYKARMKGDAELARQTEGTHQQVTPSDEFDVAQIEAAVRDQDYGRFRRVTAMFESPLRQRIGRWLQRYPEIEEQLDAEFQIDDIVEEVFLNAFEDFPARSHDVPPGDWLEHLIDPSVQAILQSPDEEFANISFARSMRQVEVD